MIRFQAPPDTILTAIVTEAISCMDAHISDDLNASIGLGWDKWHPSLARHFRPGQALELLARLDKANRATELYQLTDYHWLLLARTLQYFGEAGFEVLKESSEDKEGAVRFGRTWVETLDIDSLIDRFFWDLDFDTGPFPRGEHAMAVGEWANITPEGIRITQGLPPRPKDLLLKRVTDAGYPASPLSIRRRRLAVYPFDEDEN